MFFAVKTLLMTRMTRNTRRPIWTFIMSRAVNPQRLILGASDESRNVVPCFGQDIIPPSIPQLKGVCFYGVAFYIERLSSVMGVKATKSKDHGPPSRSAAGF